MTDEELLELTMPADREQALALSRALDRQGGEFERRLSDRCNWERMSRSDVLLRWGNPRFWSDRSPGRMESTSPGGVAYALGEEDMDTIRSCLLYGDARARRLAGRVLEHLAEQGDLEWGQVIGLVGVEEKDARLAAVSALGILGRRATPMAGSLVDRLPLEADPGVRRLACWALGRLAPAANTVVLPRLLEVASVDPDPDVRREAIAAAVAIGPEHPGVLRLKSPSGSE